jgi:uncharacterized protein (UPF0333 family)
MKTLAIIGGILAFVVFIVMMFMSVSNTAVNMEESIDAADKDRQVVLSTYGKKLAETVQVPDMYRDDLVKVTKASMEGRYGANGSKAVFQMLTEAQVPMTDKLYVQIQQVIEAGRNDFQNKQLIVVDRVRGYKASLRTQPRGFILGMMNYPKIDLNKYDIVIDDRTAEAFAKKREEAITLRPKS